MGDEFIPLKRKLEELADDTSRIAYLEKYLKEHTGIPLGLLAAIYEWLGELHNREGRFRGSYFEKAASTWETIAFVEAPDGNFGRWFTKDALKESLRIYKIAHGAYKKNDSWEMMKDVERKMSRVKMELRNYGGPSKTAGLFLVGIVFLAAVVVLIGPPTTGYAAFPIEDEQMTVWGIVLAVFGAVGSAFVLWKWR